MKNQGVIIAVIASFALILSVCIFAYSQHLRDLDFQKQEASRRSDIQKCIDVGTQKVEQDACNFYKLPYPCVVPSVGQKGENEGIQFVNEYCQKTYGKQ